MTGGSEQDSAATGPEAEVATGAATEAESATEATVADPAAIRVVTGCPTDEELAALVAVLATASGGGDPADAPVSRWNAPGTRLRSAYGPSRGGWRASGLPR